MPTHIRNSGVWREIKDQYARVSGSWRNIEKSYARVSGTWRTIDDLIPEPEGSVTFIGDTRATTNGAVKNFTWTVPANVTQVSMVCVGGGGGGGSTTIWPNGAHIGIDFNTSTCTYSPASYAGTGGGGGGLSYRTISVTPGETLNIEVGCGGRTPIGARVFKCINNGDDVVSNISCTSATDGGTSSVKRGTTTLCSASGGKKGFDNERFGGAGGSKGIGDGGGRGGHGGTHTRPSNSAICATGGGGAGGYSGNGGNGGIDGWGGSESEEQMKGTNGSGGAGGGGGAGHGSDLESRYGGALSQIGGGGGGVGIYGAGTSGSGGRGSWFHYVGDYYLVRLGTNGGNGSGGSYGGGASATGQQQYICDHSGWGTISEPYHWTYGSRLINFGSSEANAGAIRIIWGPGKSYPNNAS